MNRLALPYPSSPPLPLLPPRQPENILLKSAEDDTSIKIADLGFARLIPTTPGSTSAAIMKTPCG